MKIIIQRVEHAQVEVDGSCVGKIGRGLLLYVGFSKNFSPKHLEDALTKIIKLRIFSDENGKMNLSLNDVGGSLLIVSQFTLWGSLERGNRPSFSQAAPPAEARSAYDAFVLLAYERLSSERVATGIFGADMKVSSVNDGPVTFIYENLA